MKKLFLFLLTICLLSACAPSPKAIQNAGEQTRAAWTPIATQTPYPTYTEYPTYTKIPTLTPTITPNGPTETPLGQAVYIVETGFCLLSVPDISGQDPKTNHLCSILTRTRQRLDPDMIIDFHEDNLNGTVDVYCAMFSLDGVFLMSDVNVTGGTIVQCGPGDIKK